jgi:hypothetical protein
MTYKTAIHILYAYLFSYFIIAVFTLMANSQSTTWDASLCLKMTDNGYKHIPFNYYTHPNPQNLNEDQYEFVTWWSPGQFALPLLIVKCLNVRLAAAIKLLTLFCLVISALGIFRLFKQLIRRQNSQIAPLSIQAFCLACVAFILALPFFWGNLNFYDGGGILSLAYCPWFLYWVVKHNGITALNLLILLLLGLIGFFLKSSFTSVFIGAVLYLFLVNSISSFSTSKDRDFKIIVNAFYLGSLLVIYILTVKFAFLSHNRGISDSSAGLRIQPRVVFFPFNAPLLCLLSLDRLNKTYQWMLVSVLSLPVYYVVLKSKHINLVLKCALISFVGGCICFYLFIYFVNYDVSYELRHFRIASILLTPALFLVFWNLPRFRYLSCGLTALYFAVNSFGYIENFIRTTKSPEPIYTVSGLRSAYPAELLKEIHRLDHNTVKNHDIFFLRSDDPAIALEVRNSRVLLEDNFINFHFNNQLRFSGTLYFGINSGQIYIVYPLVDFKNDSSLYLTRFEKYKKFKSIYQTKGFIILKAIATEK